jgi:hypothetical protein
MLSGAGRSSIVASPYDISWQVIAQAVGVAGVPEDANGLVKAVLAAAEMMAKSFSCSYSYRSNGEKCPLVDILHLAWKAMSDKFVVNEGFVGASKSLEEALKTALVQLVSKPIGTPDHAMPKEADIAGRKQNGSLGTTLEAFLRSSAEIVLKLDFGKAGACTSNV